MKNDQLFFVSGKAFIEKDGQVLLLSDPQIGLDIPGGKIQEGETDFILSLQREVLEETGLTIDVGSVFTAWVYTIPVNSNHRSAGKKICSIGYRCTYISGEVALSSEHSKYLWVNKDNYRKISIDTSFAKALDLYFGMS